MRKAIQPTGSEPTFFHTKGSSQGTLLAVFPQPHQVIDAREGNQKMYISPTVLGVFTIASVLVFTSCQPSEVEGDEAGECTDGIDNDGNLLKDCAEDICCEDPECFGTAWCEDPSGDDDTTQEWTPTFEGAFTFRSDSARSGVSESEIPTSPTQLEVLWSLPGIPAPGLAVANDTLFLTTNDGLRVFATEDGTDLWAAPLDTLYGTPTIAGGRLFLQSFSNGRIIALDAADGNELWRTEIGVEASVQPSPLVADNMVYVGAGDWDDELTGMYALDAATGEEIWSYRDLDRWRDYDGRCLVIGAASLLDDTLYFATSGAECFSAQCEPEFYIIVYALNASNGALVWKAELDATWYYDPVAPLPVTNEHVLLSSVVDTTIGSTTPSNGKLIALNRSDGSTDWMVEYSANEGKVYWNPAASEGTVYASIAEWDGDEWVRVMAAYRDSDGVRLWTAPYRGYGPVVVGPYLVYNEAIHNSDESNFTVLNRTDGSLVGQLPLSGAALENQFPVVHQGTAFIETEDYELLAIQLPSAG